jgi:hypothetical protein
LIFVVVMQGGDQLCQLACDTSISIRQLKAKVEVESGLKAAALAINLPEVAQPLGQNVTLADCGLPSVLIALTLHKIAIANMLGVSPGQLTGAQLAQACSTDKGKAGDLVDLTGCAAIREMSCLVRLQQMQELNTSGCTGIDATAVPTVVAKNRTLSALIFGDGMVEPAAHEVGLTEADFRNKSLGMGGAIIISAWITHRDKGATTSLDLASNNLRVGGAKIVAAAIKVSKCTPAIILAPSSYPSDFLINCCCLLFAIIRGIWVR